MELSKHQKRILDFNPKEIYDKIQIDKYSRVQSISITKMFPKQENKICSCGCGQKLEGRRSVWATDSCMRFAQSVWGIINGHSETISFYLRKMFPQWACCKCGLTDSYKEFKNGLNVNEIHKDHIVAVVNGGGGCWLDNYQLLCKECHKEKTKIDLKK